MRGHFLKPTNLMFASDLDRDRKRAGGAVSLTGVSRRSLSNCYTQNTLLWAWRGPRHARFHSHLRLHRAGHSDRMHAWGSGSGSLSTQAITLGQGPRDLRYRNHRCATLDLSGGRRT